MSKLGQHIATASDNMQVQDIIASLEAFLTPTSTFQSQSGYVAQWRIQDFEKGGSVPIPRSRRQCIEVRRADLSARRADLSARSAEKKFSPPFFIYQDGLSWHRGVGNEQFWRTRFPDFSLISP